MERLTEKDLFMGNITFKCGEHEKDCDGNCQDKSCGLLCALVKKFKEYEDLEEQGKLLKLPCAAGDTVYCIMTSIKGTNPTIFSQKFDHGMIESFGKAVFLTREEAEAALKEL